MEEAIIWIIIIIAIIILLLPVLFKYILPGLYAGLAVLAFYVFYLLDALFSASLTPHAPFLMWLCWGALFGAAFAFWTVAPRYGLRGQRHFILIAPCALMLLLAAVRMLFLP